jgi:hypothetical protein
MSQQRSRQLWLVNAASFILLTLLAVSGLLNWMLPRGPETRGALAGLRHFLVDFHGWTALFFSVTIAIHLALHWSYIQANLNRLRKGP